MPGFNHTNIQNYTFVKIFFTRSQVSPPKRNVETKQKSEKKVLLRENSEVFSSILAFLVFLSAKITCEFSIELFLQFLKETSLGRKLSPEK